MDPMSAEHPSPLTRFGEIEAALRDVAAPTGAAECHGILSGMLCGPEDLGEETWLREVLGDGDPAGLAPCREALGRLRAETARQLYAGRFEFTPLLPADDESLAHRSVALGKWCQGFLLGLGLSGLHDLAALSGESREVVSDFSEFTRIEPEPEPGEEAESAYAELVEYVRAGVLLINEELHGSAGPEDTIH